MAAPLDLAAQLLDQRRLAHPGAAGDQQHLAGALDGPLEQLGQLLALARTAVEGGPDEQPVGRVPLGELEGRDAARNPPPTAGLREVSEQGVGRLIPVLGHLRQE